MSRKRVASPEARQLIALSLTGGKKILLRSCGKDATEQFHNFHSPSVLKKQAAPLLIGRVEGAEEAEAPAEEEDTTYFGDLVP